MNNNKIKNRNLISRFSSSLLGRGKKAEGYKTFFNLLLFLKVNTERQLLNLNLQQSKLKTPIFNTSFVYFLHSIGFQEKALQNLFPKNEKAFQSIAKVYSQNSLSLDGYLDNDSYVSQKPSHSPKSTLLKNSPREWNKDSVNALSYKAKLCRNVEEKKQQYVPEKTDSFVSSTQAFPSKLLCKNSIENVKPILETRKVRKGRMTYRIPLVTRTERQEGKAISWLIAGASSRKNKVKNGQSVSYLGTSLSSPSVKAKVNSSVTFSNMPKSEKSISLNLKTVDERSTIVEDRKKNYRSLQYCLADSLLEASQRKGESVEKRKEYHQLALQNRAYTHYRWW